MLIWCKHISYNALKTVVPLNIFEETMIYFYTKKKMQDSLMNKVNLFCNIINDFTNVGESYF